MPDEIHALVIKAKSELPYETGSYERLMRLCEKSLYATCLHILKDAHLAEDALQETMLRIFHYLPSLRQDEIFRTWIYRIAYNESIDIVKKHSRYFSVADILADFSVEHREVTDVIEVEQLLERVNEGDRWMLIMKYITELSDQEISDEMDISLSALKMRLKRIKERLAKEKT